MEIAYEFARYKWLLCCIIHLFLQGLKFFIGLVYSSFYTNRLLKHPNILSIFKHGSKRARHCLRQAEVYH